MHLSEALMSREEAIQLARETLEASLRRNAAYYDRAPQLRPDPQQPRTEAVRADDAWYYVPFNRGKPGLEPIVVRVNGLTRAVVIDPPLRSPGARPSRGT
jgi:hypothetical protein